MCEQSEQAYARCLAMYDEIYSGYSDMALAYMVRTAISFAPDKESGLTHAEHTNLLCMIDLLFSIGGRVDENLMKKYSRLT